MSQPRPPRRHPPALVRSALVGFVIAAAVTAAMSPAAGDASFSKAAVYLAVVAVTGALLGPLTAAVTALLSMVGLWFVFYPPHYSFVARSWEDVAGIVTATFTAAVIVVVVALLDRSKQGAVAGEERVRALLRVALGLTSVRTRAELREVLTEQFRSVLGARSIAVVEPAGEHESWGLTIGYEGRVDPEWLQLVDHGSPARHAMATGEPVYLRSVAELEARWPHLGPVVRSMGEPCRAGLPLALDDGTRGAVTIGWSDVRRFDTQERALVETLVAMLASAVRRIRRSERAVEAEYVNVLEAMLDGVAVYRAIRDPAGAVVDFELRFFNSRSASLAEGDETYVGRALTDVYPPARETELLLELVRVLETGEPFVRDPYRFRTREGLGRPVALSVSRQDDETVVLVVRDVTERERVRRERETAVAEAGRRQAVVEELQRAFLPEVLPSLDSHVISARYVPAGRDAPVGGDWYDAFTTPSGSLLLVVGDVAGHGIAASGLMSLVRSAIRAYANENRSPAEILEGADRLVATMEGFATCWLASYDPETGVYTWANAGHPPPLIVARDDTRFVAGEPDAPLGLVTRTRFDRADVLGEKDALVLYSDGLVERRDETLTEGLARLRAVAASLDPVDDALPDQLLAGMPAGPGARDDLCILVVQRR
ncbi:MAG TPA: SpoIIE family protein phosphatase [Acidimicrobiia bacterium]|nr:SpoIIE family protein phosphatase [Acidimicrobiia bacterium]